MGMTWIILKALADVYDPFPCCTALEGILDGQSGYRVDERRIIGDGTGDSSPRGPDEHISIQ